MAKIKAKTEDDSDLEDLLGESRGEGGHTQTSAMNLDHVTKSKIELPSALRSQSFHRPSSILTYSTAWISTLCYFHPRLCALFVFILVFGFMLLLGNFLFNPVEEFGVIRHDHANIQSSHDLKMGQIDHWCLKGGDNSCRCEDPTMPLSRAEFKSWVEAFKANRKIVKRYQDTTKDVDLAIIGESVIEEMDGRWMGRNRNTAGMRGLETMFKKNFNKKKGAKINGVALGIAGDTSSNVLWRLMHGEMPDYFNPKVWWLNLGGNDLGRMQCSEEVVVIGVLRVVEEILEKKPKAQVVINSILPMISIREGLYPVVSDFQDSFRQKGGDIVVASNGNNQEDASSDDDNSRQLRRRDDRPPVVAREKLKKTPQEEAEEVAREEDARDRLYRRKHKREYRKSAPINPKLLDKTKIRKYKPVTAFTKERAIPLWTSIKAINRALKKFADGHDRVTFFDASDIFTTTNDNARFTMRSDRITIRGHPTMRGYQLWEEAIVKQTESILTKMRQTDPSIFVNQDRTDDNVQISEDALGDDWEMPQDDNLDSRYFDNGIDDEFDQSHGDNY